MTRFLIVKSGPNLRNTGPGNMDSIWRDTSILLNSQIIAGPNQPSIRGYRWCHERWSSSVNVHLVQGLIMCRPVRHFRHTFSLRGTSLRTEASFFFLFLFLKHAQWNINVYITNKHEGKWAIKVHTLFTAITYAPGLHISKPPYMSLKQLHVSFNHPTCF